MNPALYGSKLPPLMMIVYDSLDYAGDVMRRFNPNNTGCGNEWTARFSCVTEDGWNDAGFESLVNIIYIYIYDWCHKVIIRLWCASHHHVHTYDMENKMIWC